MARARAVIVALLVLAALVVGAVWSAGDDGPESADAGSHRPESTESDWEACRFPDEEPDIAASFEAAFADYRCATVVVPIDDDDPERGTLEVFVQMRPAPAPDPIGPLFVNQGRPGVSAAT